MRYLFLSLILIAASCRERPRPVAAAPCYCDTAHNPRLPPPPPPPPNARLALDSVPVDIRGVRMWMRASVFLEQADVAFGGATHALLRIEASDPYFSRSLRFLDPWPLGCIDSIGIRSRGDRLYIGHRSGPAFCTLYRLSVNNTDYERLRREEPSRNLDNLSKGLIDIRRHEEVLR